MATAAQLRAAILDCAAKAIAAEPTNTEARLHSFIARLSPTMEHLGEPELDAALWALFETAPAVLPATLDTAEFRPWSSGKLFTMVDSTAKSRVSVTAIDVQDGSFLVTPASTSASLRETTLADLTGDEIGSAVVRSVGDQEVAQDTSLIDAKGKGQPANPRVSKE